MLDRIALPLTSEVRRRGALISMPPFESLEAERVAH